MSNLLNEQFSPELRITELNLHTAQVVDIRTAQATLARLEAIGLSPNDSLNLVRRVATGHGYETAHAWWRVSTPQDLIELQRRKNAEAERDALRAAAACEL